MAHEAEPLTSLLIRETSIAARAAAKLSDALWRISRVLREHLQPELNNARMAINKGKSGAESDEAASQADPFPADLFTGVDVKFTPRDPEDPKTEAPIDG